MPLSQLIEYFNTQYREKPLIAEQESISGRFQGLRESKKRGLPLLPAMWGRIWRKATTSACPKRALMILKELRSSLTVLGN